MSVSRRSFLAGASAAAVAAAMPPVAVRALDEAAAKEMMEALVRLWHKDTAEIFAQMVSDQIVFGRAILQHTDKYPFVELLHPWSDLADCPTVPPNGLTTVLHTPPLAFSPKP